MLMVTSSLKVMANKVILINDMFKEMDHYVCPKDKKEADCNMNNEGARKVSACGKCVEVKELKSTMGEKCF